MHSPISSKSSPAPVAIVGSSCRLPGAPDVRAFWELLKCGACAITEIGNDRWHSERFWHPRASEAGFSYSFAAGLLDDPFAFDPAAFGISPREAEQMDPQQRLLLELVWEALEDAGIPPSNLKGSNTGVFVGASSLDYGSRQMADMASVDAHFMIGNTLSVIANRISYIYGLNGPSFTVDTACSSSLVALNQAMLALDAGAIDAAIVAGVNIIASPMSFVGFSRAGMLSPTGLCRPFAAAADGYVRAEGGVVMVIRRLAAARADGERPRAIVVASGVNSDGRTSGLALPSAQAQCSLLEQIYREHEIDANDLAFVEAHGTGTRVGDPAEAAAIGRALGQRRTRPLPIGSVKSNIGHLEPASGLAGILKAMLALEHKHLPASLHCDALNPDIAFGELNLAAVNRPIDLADAAGPLHAGVSSFGFGGTNAHVVLRAPTARERTFVRKREPRNTPEFLMISAHSQPALRVLATGYSEMLARGAVADIAAATAHRRDALTHRLVLPLADARSMAGALARHGRGDTAPEIETAKTAERSRPVAFVYSGNGAQWAGMGRDAWNRNAAFREEFRAIDALHRWHADWSLCDMLLAPDLEDRLKLTSIAQPLLFAVQSALTAALGELGLRPDAVLGHSVGEIAAAEACGALSRAAAVALIHRRSQTQERARGLGLMLALKLSAADAQHFLAENMLDGLEIAAINSPTGVTLAGPAASIAKAERAARERRLAARVLDVDYPFHSRLLAPFEDSFIAPMADGMAGPGAVPFVSTVTGARLDGAALDTRYWWRNIREPVRFAEAVKAAAQLGCGVFVEIGPQPILLANIAETIPDTAAIASLDKSVQLDGPDPVVATLARAIAHGAKIDRNRVFGSRPGRRVDLPSYPWQRTRFRAPATPDAVDVFGLRPRHPLIGARLTDTATEWRTTLDPVVVPYLADHKVHGDIVMPAAGFAEMALAAARDWFGDGPLLIEDFDIVQALVFADGAMREIAVRLTADTQVLEILSRPRLTSEWSLHARGRIGRPASPDPVPAGPRGDDLVEADGTEIYARAAELALEYGPEFRRVLRARHDGTVMEVEFLPNPGGAGRFSLPQVLPPPVFDVAFHGLFVLRPLEEQRTYLPVRIGALRVHQPGAAVVRAILRLNSHNERSLAANFALLDAEGAIVAMAEDVRFQAAELGRRAENVFFRIMPVRVSSFCALDVGAAIQDAISNRPDAPAPREDWLLLVAFARSLAHRTMSEIAGSAPASLRQLVERGALAASSVPLASALLNGLAEAGLAAEAHGIWTLAAASGLPPPDAILRTFCADHPARSAELLMAARVLADLAEVLRSGEPVAYQATLVEQFEAESLLVADGLKLIRDIVERIGAQPEAVLLRVLVAEPGALAVIRVLLPLLRAGNAVVTVAGLDAKRLSAIEARIGRLAGLSFADLGADADALDALPPFDLALANGMPSPFGGESGLGRAMAGALRPQGALLALQPRPSLVADMLLGVTAGWFAHSVAPEAGPWSGEEDLRLTLNDAGFDAVELHPVAGAAAVLAVASPRPAAARPAGNAAIAAIFAPRSEQDARFAAHVAHALQSLGRPVSHLHDARSRRLASESTTVVAHDKVSWASAIVSCCGESPGMADLVRLARYHHNDPSAALAAAILRFAAMLEGVRAAARRPRVWLVTQGALTDSAFAAGVWAFGRVAINEYPEIDIRLVDLSRDLDEAEAAGRLAALIAAPGTETEILIDRRGVSVMRAGQGLPDGAAPAPPDAAARLQLTSPHSSDRHAWRAVERVGPAAGEVEIEVAATGVNFRDVMLATGLLPDDILAGGLAGATLGLECAGQVVRVGDRVTSLKPGDRVAAFARGAFATHVTVPAALALPMPAAMSPEAGAGIPVAFLTAWYGLIHLAKLKRNEWVLIHAAAGGVGLAALQIARWRGARIVATAGSDDKRALLRLLGADMVLDSRSLAFADQIRRSIGGVHVVLNSLSGAAMEASLKVLKPFGRFVELGKRDYVANSRVGLRPFRHNLTYYGVDADQLLSQQQAFTRKLSRDLMRLFADGSLSPLPHRVYDADDVAEAFLLMQRAGHAGKLVVRPPRVVPPQSKFGPFVARAEGSHLVVGGTSGFGFATARWLVERGARTIVVASRRGALAPELEGEAAALRARGVELIAAHVDVTRRDSVDWLIHWIESQHGPLAGVIHAAMVLDDAPMAGLDEARIAAVLAPKVDGALHLDQATRHARLDYFVMYSSATTLIGNPGQASYVAANGFLEGLARQRRAEKLPALAVAWGPIADAGVLARDAAAGSRLARRTGRIGLKARDALAHLGRLLSRDGDAAGQAVVACAAIDWRAASAGLKILKTPLYAMLRVDAAEGMAETIDIAALLRDKTEAEARAVVTALVARQVAAILRVGAEDIDARRPLAEIGMDSLMGIELKMAVEDRFGIEIPLMAMTASKSLADIVTHMIAQLQPRRADEPLAAGAPDERLVSVRQGGPLLDRHGAGMVVPEGLDRLAEAVEQRRKATRRLAE